MSRKETLADLGRTIGELEQGMPQLRQAMFSHPVGSVEFIRELNVLVSYEGRLSALKRAREWLESLPEPRKEMFDAY